MVNVVGFLGFEHQAVSHMTGSTSQLGMALAQGDWRAVGHLWGLLIAFSLGAMLSGLLIQDSTLQLGRRYGVALALESALLLVAIPLFERHQIWGALAAADGLRPAPPTSAAWTSIGLHLLRGLPLQVRRLTLSGLIISGFLARHPRRLAVVLAVRRPACPRPADRPDRTGLCAVPAVGALAALRAVRSLFLRKRDLTHLSAATLPPLR